MGSPKIVVGGMPSVGKTSICGHLAREFNIDMMLSGDYLREFLRGSFGEDRRYEILKTSVYDAWKKFGERTRENIVKGYLEQGELISLGLNAVLERAVKNGESLTLETLYFLPDKLPAIKKEGVIPLYIYVSDPAVYRKMILEREKFTHPGQPGNRLAAQMDAYMMMADHALKECQREGIQVFNNLDYMKTRAEITKFVRSSIKS